MLGAQLLFEAPQYPQKWVWEGLALPHMVLVHHQSFIEDVVADRGIEVCRLGGEALLGQDGGRLVRDGERVCCLL